jgi:hypothetical protein
MTAGEDVESGNYYTVLGMTISTVIMEISILKITQKLKTELSYDPAIPLWDL